LKIADLHRRVRIELVDAAERQKAEANPLG
jgi:hypothetical protein